MSHATLVKAQFKDKQCLFKTLQELGWEIKEKAKIRTYASDPARKRTFDYVAVNPMEKGYDVGFMEEKGQLVPYCDFFGGSVSATLGPSLRTLKQKYAYNLIKQEATELTILEQFENGSMILDVNIDL